ncbi:MAG: hypothetical protein ABIV63_19320 [Caldimonas sp.]
MNLIRGQISRTFARVASGALVVALTASCATAQTDATGDARATLRRLIGDAACESDSQCRTVAVGAKSCGGPEAYLAWSTLGSDRMAIEAASVRSAEAARRESQKSGLLSNCAMVVDPGATCVPRGARAATALGGVASGAESARACTLRAPRAGGGGAAVY